MKTGLKTKIKFMRHHHITRVMYVSMIAFLIATGLVLGIFAQVPKAQAIGGWGVGGRLVPAPPPPAGDFDVLTNSIICGPLVSVIGPEGGNWGVYVWTTATPHDYWSQSYITNGWPYTHAGEYMLGYAMPNPIVTCPPLLTSIGTSLFKATLP